MRIGYYDRKNTGPRLTIIPENHNESTALAVYFPDVAPAAKGIIALPYSLESYKRIRDVFGEKYEVTPNSDLPIQRLKARERIERHQFEVCTEAYEKHLKGFIDSGFDPEYPDRLPVDFEPNMTPMSHQKAAINYILDTMDVRKGFALYFDMGLGKTFTSLSVLEYIIELGEVKNALVIAPLTTLWTSWFDDVSKATNMTANVLYSTKNGVYKMRELESSITKRHAHVYITNFETFRIDQYRELFGERYDFDCIIVDESSRIKNPKSMTYKKIKAFADDRDIEWRWCLSGTPAPKGVGDLWAQFSFLDGGIALGESWKQYQDRYMMDLPNSKFVKVPRAGSFRDVYERIKPYMIVFKKDDVLDLPKRMHILKMVEIDDAARIMYENIEKDGLAILDSDGKAEVIEAKNILNKFQYLRQITGGFLYRDKKLMQPGEGPHRMPSQKLEMTMEIIQGIMEQNDEDKVIVWGSFTYELDRLCNSLSEKKISHTRAFDSIGSKATLKAIDSFRDDANIRVMVASRASIGVGTNLQIANYAIYYSLDEDLEKFQQSLDRIYRIGQTKRVINYYLIARDTYDEKLVTILRKKENIQNFLTQGEKITREKLRNPKLAAEWKIED